jgi:ATP-dependent DNA helicase HFM1/MER3
MVKTKLGYTNAKTPVWNGKRPSLTLMAETSEGTLVHFWRGNIQKLDKGWEVKFTVELSDPDDHIKCYVACDEIVGTSRSSVIKPDIPASEFPVKNLKEPFSENTKFTPQYGKSDAADEFGGDDYDDEEILELAKSAEATVSEYGSDDFVDIDDLIGTDAAASAENEEEESEDAAEPVQMGNGKWACNHHCRGQPLKNGQPCKHRCCREGLDKPRKPPKKKVCLCSCHIKFEKGVF